MVAAVLPPDPDVSWWLLAGGTAALAVAATARLAGADPLVGAFGDGRSYRRMARGEAGSPPFSRRVLGPALARALGGDGPRAFRRVSVPALAGAAAGVGALTARVAAAGGVAPRRAAAAGLTAAALVPLLPHGVRLSVQVPEFNDALAAALGTGWLLLVTGDGPGPLLAPAAALAAALAREQWGVVVPVVLAAVQPGAAVVLAHAGAVVGAAAVIAAQPSAPGSEVWGPGHALRRLASLPGAGEALWAAAFVPGALLALVPAAARTAARGGGSPALTACLVAAAAQGALGHLGGTDLPRLDSGALLPLLPAVLGVAARGPALAPALALAATVPAWRPFTPLRPTQPGYESFYLPYMDPPMRPRLLGDAARRLAGLGTAAALRAAVRAARRACMTA